MPSRVRRALLVAALLAIPALLSAQARAGAARRVDLVMVTAASVRVRTAPYGSSLSIEDVGKGTVFHVAADEYQSKDWIGVILDGRVAFVPRDAVAPRAYGARSSPVEEAPVIQAAMPTPVAPASVSAPAGAVASRQAAPGQAVSQAPGPFESPRAEPIVAPKTEPPAQVVASTPPRAAERQPDLFPATQQSKAPEPAPASAAETKESSRFRVPRPSFGVTLGAFGSVTPIRTAGVPTAAHVAGVSFVGLHVGMLGIYGAPEFGQGGGYRSTMIGGGGSLDIIRLHMLHVSVLGGVAKYSETTMPTDTTVAAVTRSLQGTSVGGIASIPFVGPLRLGYRGQYFMTKNAGVSAEMTRHYVGLVF